MKRAEAIIDSKVIRCFVTTTFRERFLGLMFRRGLEPGTGLLIRPCSSIHTFFMRFPIDVVHIGEDHRIVAIDRALGPWRISHHKGVKCILEMPAGSTTRLMPGLPVEFREEPLSWQNGNRGNLAGEQGR